MIAAHSELLRKFTELAFDESAEMRWEEARPGATPNAARPARWASRTRSATGPNAQTQVFGQQQPDADLIAGNFVGQSLANLTLQASGIGFEGTLFFAGALGLDKLGRVGGIKGVEFFFAGRNRR